jgi:hypothetical protein
MKFIERAVLVRRISEMRSWLAAMLADNSFAGSAAGIAISL